MEERFRELGGRKNKLLPLNKFREAQIALLLPIRKNSTIQINPPMSSDTQVPNTHQKNTSPQEHPTH